MVHVKSLIATLAVALLTVACTVTVVPGSAAPTTDVERPRPPSEGAPSDVDRPRPDPGLPNPSAFATFEIGPSVVYPETVLYFRVQVQRTGYMTISVMAPDGRVDVLARNVAVEAGRQVLYPPIAGPIRWQATAPLGAWRIRAQWTPVPTSARFDGLVGLESWTEAILRDLAGLDTAGVAEVGYEVLRR